jgi:outer membrane protein OmpA-like peptidoglycan-associated protein
MADERDPQHSLNPGESAAVPTGARHVFVVPSRRTFIVQVFTDGGTVAQDVSVQLDVPGTAQSTRFTDADGRAPFVIPGGARLGVVTLPHVPPGPHEPQPPTVAGAVRWTGAPIEHDVRSDLLVQLPPRVVRARLTGILFDTSKCFILPSALDGLRRLTLYYERWSGAHVLVVGHTDTVGPQSYNRPLSCERAESVAAYLHDDVDAWLAWYGADKPFEKRWGTLEDQHMLAHVEDDTGAPFWTGACDGNAYSPGYGDAVMRFQQWANDTQGAGLATDGVMGPASRRPLVTEYMAEDGTTLPPDITLWTHGCGESHPVIPTGDEVEEDRNRRVEIFVFEHEIVPPVPEGGGDDGCSEYPAWVAQIVHHLDLDEEPLRLVAADWEA